MSDLRSLLNPPSETAGSGSMESLLNPIPGRLPIDEDSRHEETEHGVLCSIDRSQEPRAAA